MVLREHMTKWIWELILNVIMFCKFPHSSFFCTHQRTCRRLLENIRSSLFENKNSLIEKKLLCGVVIYREYFCYATIMNMNHYKICYIKGSYFQVMNCKISHRVISFLIFIKNKYRDYNELEVNQAKMSALIN